MTGLRVNISAPDYSGVVREAKARLDTAKASSVTNIHSCLFLTLNHLDTPLAITFPVSIMSLAKHETKRLYDDVLVSIVNYVYEFEVKSEVAWRNARLALLDALGCAMESLEISDECVRMLGPVWPGVAVAGATVPNGFKLPGTKFQLDPIKGAFDMGAMIRYLDHNDAFPGHEWGHPSGILDTSTL